MTASSSDVWRKDPSDALWFDFDWADWLTDGETITSHTITVPGLDLVADAVIDSRVVFKVSDGAAGTKAWAKCAISTSADNTYEAEKAIHIRERKSS